MARIDSIFLSRVLSPSATSFLKMLKSLIVRAVVVKVVPATFAPYDARPPVAGTVAVPLPTAPCST